MPLLSQVKLRATFWLVALTLPVVVSQVQAGVSAAAESQRAGKPNVVFIFIDDMGYADPACFGNKSVKTPAIDSLAEHGLRLTNFYVNSPICSPSRVAVTTGQYPGRWAIHSYFASRAANRRRGMADWLDPKAPSIGRIFKKAG